MRAGWEFFPSLIAAARNLIAQPPAARLIVSHLTERCVWPLADDNAIRESCSKIWTRSSISILQTVATKGMQLYQWRCKIVDSLLKWYNIAKEGRLVLFCSVKTFVNLSFPKMSLRHVTSGKARMLFFSKIVKIQTR